MSNVNFLIKFFNHEVKVGQHYNWSDYAKRSAEFAQQLESNADLTTFADYFKSVDFEHKDLMLEVLEQDAERPDLAELLTA